MRGRTLLQVAAPPVRSRDVLLRQPHLLGDAPAGECLRVLLPGYLVERRRTTRTVFNVAEN